MALHDSLISLLGRGPAPEQLQHVREVPARSAVTVPWPPWLHPDIVQAYRTLGVQEPWRHQILGADAAHDGNHVVIATGTASGKSLAYQLPALDAVHRAELNVLGNPGKLEQDGAVALYLSPTKALAADQFAAIQSLHLPTVRAATYDGDTDQSQRRWIRDHANFVLCNPDMLHFGVLPNHGWWARFFRRLKYVIIDEAHSYRGVFGSHVANLMRRLRRICAHYGADPVFIAASATSSDPAVSFGRLIGAPVTAVTEDCSPHGATTVAFWEPALTELKGENGAKERRTAIAETADLLANLVSARIRTIAFIKSRRGAESISSIAKRLLEDVDRSLPPRIAAYRSGYLPEERRALERALRSGELLGVSSTSALELGIDISGLDAVLVAGWPGTRASLFQQIGRAGRAGQDAGSRLCGQRRPPGYLSGPPPRGHLRCPGRGHRFRPLQPVRPGPSSVRRGCGIPNDRRRDGLFGPTTSGLLEKLVSDGYLRRRPAGWFWTHPQSAASMVNLRADGGGPINIVEADTGTLLGTMDSPQAHYQAHRGAIYVHQGDTFLVEELNEQDHCAVVRRSSPDYYTTARDVTQIEVLESLRHQMWGPVEVHFGEVQVTTQVVSFQRKAFVSNEVLGEEPLDLGARDLFTKAVWFTLDNRTLLEGGLAEPQFPGALHAAEHAAIGLLPLVASSDRWDVGGVSTAIHADTGQPTIFVYDGHPGGAGFAERGFDAARIWLKATRDAISACECEAGCPSCVQSPKCGNKNNPLDKAGALTLIDILLDGADQGERAAGQPAAATAAESVPAVALR